MTEVTKRNFKRLLVIVLAYSSCLLIQSKAQTQNDVSYDKFNYLLDSAEILKLKGKYDQAIALCDLVANEAGALDHWKTYSMSLVEKADILRFTYYFSKDIHTLERSMKIIDESRQIIEDYSIKSDAYWVKYYIYRSKVLLNSRVELFISAHDSINRYFNAAASKIKGISDNKKVYVYALNELGKHYYRIDSIRKAKYYYRELLSDLDKNFSPLDYLRGYYLYESTLFYYRIADYERASLLAIISNYIFHYPRNYDKMRALQSEILFANTMHSFGDYQLAFVHYQNTINLIKTRVDENYENLLLGYINGGEALLKINSIDSSILYSQRALSINRLKNSRDSLKLSYTYLNLGKAYAEKHLPKIAENYFSKSQDLVSRASGPNHFRTHAVIRHFGNFYEENEQYDQALEKYQQAIMVLFTQFKSDNCYEDPPYHENENIEQIFYVLTDKSGALYKRYLSNGNMKDLIAAFKLYRIGYRLLESLLQSNFMDESVIQVFEGFRDALNLSIECAFDLYEITGESIYLYQGFQFIEKSKYFLLSKALANESYKQKHWITDEYFLMDRQLNQEINKIKHSINNEFQAKEDNTFGLQNMLLKKLIIKDSLQAQNDLYNSIKINPNLDSMLLTIENVQKELVCDDELIIEFHWAVNFIYALCIGKDKVNIHKIERSNELLNHIDNYSNSISREILEDGSAGEFKKYVASSHFLFQKLLNPILEGSKYSFASEGKITKLTIVPDGQLSYLPFEPMLTRIPDTTTVSYWNLPYLLHDYTIRYAYSLNILRNNLTTNQIIRKPAVLAFSYSKSLHDTIHHDRFQREIRYSAEELNTIKSIVREGEFYEDRLATEVAFKSRASRFSVIHLALHGQADKADQFNSKLLFRDDNSSSEDGELHAYELYNLDLHNTEMAVLSACETGLGEQTEGEGIFSIARGFAYAGCPSIIMSFWKVSDKTTAEIMRYFYENLASGMLKDDALQYAKIAYIKASDDIGSHPCNWAAFIALGNNSPVKLPSDQFRWYQVLIVFILIISMLYLLHFKKRRKESVEK